MMKKSKIKDSKFIVVSMFTIGTPYEDEAKKLQASLDKFNLQYEITGIENKGNWQKNTQMKTQVIRNAMEKYDTAIVWIDADAELLKYPDFFDNIDCDISYYLISRGKCSNIPTGTLYFANTKICKEFIDEWIRINNSNNLADAFNFYHAIKTKPGLRYIPLPADYIKIIGNKEIESNDPVIIHNEASKRFKPDLIIKHSEKLSTKRRI